MQKISRQRNIPRVRCMTALKSLCDSLKSTNTTRKCYSSKLTPQVSNRWKNGGGICVMGWYEEAAGNLYEKTVHLWILWCFMRFGKKREKPMEECHFHLSSIPPWVFFTFFKLYKWHQIKQNITIFRDRLVFHTKCQLIFTKCNTPPWVFFRFFKLYKWYQIAQNIAIWFNVFEDSCQVLLAYQS